jgi:hypothetical protein
LILVKHLTPIPQEFRASSDKNREMFHSPAFIRARCLPSSSSFAQRLVLAALMVFLAPFSAQFSHAETGFDPIRDPAELRDPKIVETVHVATAKPVLVDYGLLRKDFPQLREMNEAEIDHWLLTFTARIAKTQVTQTTVNTPIQHYPDPLPMAAYRPATYGRALVFEVPGGLIDVKGAGAEKPGLGHHSNGLASLGESVREFLYQKAVQKLFEHAQADVSTVGVYGVIDYGFDVVFGDGSAPAGLILRQAHTRSPLTESRLSAKRALQIENVLRPYGFTSTGLRFNMQKTHVINIQGTRDESAILDFGTFLVLNEDFSRPMFYGLDPRKKIEVDSNHFVRMTPRLRISSAIWGSPGVVDPTLDNPWLWSHELARNWRAGAATREHFELHVRNMMAPIDLVTSTQERIVSSPGIQCVKQLLKSPKKRKRK